MAPRSLLILATALAFAVVAEVIVNRVDSVILAWTMLLVLPVAAGSFAGWASVPGGAGCLVVVLSIVAFFVTGAIIATGSSASLIAEIISYAVLGVIMTGVGMLSYLAMRGATSADRAVELDE